MSDELDKLREAMNATKPTPDSTARAENLAQSMSIFDEVQGTHSEPRQTSEHRSITGRVTAGVLSMFQSISQRGALVATTALVAVGLVMVLPQSGDMLQLPPGGLDLNSEMESRQDADTTLFDDERSATSETKVDTLRVVKPATPDGAEELAVTGQLLAQPKAEAGVVFLEVAPSVAASPRHRSLERDLTQAPGPVANTEAFANEAPSSLQIVLDDPVSTFSIDVDTASYAVVRSSLMSGYLPPRDAVRIEEMINYFPYAYAAPTDGEAPFAHHVSVTQTPWNPDTRLVQIALQGQRIGVSARAPLNLVFLIDTSGSMQDADKLPLLKQSFRLMLGQLKPDDQVSIVTYAGSSGQVLEPTNASERSKILTALDQLESGGGTAGQAGLQQAYSVAEDMAEDGEITRVILATDGDFNLGLSNPEMLAEFIADKRKSGTFLSVLGFGRGNLDDATMQALAQNGNGTAAYIDTLNEAQKVLVDQLSGALFTIASDVKVQVEFNPSVIAEYRLIGYETRALAREDFNNDRVDAGDVGAGHSVTAIYEVTPVGSPAISSHPLRYQDVAAPSISDELGFLRLRYKEPGEDRSKLIETPIAQVETAPGIESQFATAIAGFGELLRGSNYVTDWSWDDAIALASTSLGEDPFGYRREALNLMRLAQSLAKP